MFFVERTPDALLEWGREAAGRNDHALAERLLRQALTLGERKPAWDVGPCLNELGSVIVEQGRAAEAVPFLERALAIAETRLGADDVGTAPIAKKLGDALLAARRRKDAGIVYVKAWRRLENRLARRKAIAGDVKEVAGWLGQLDELAIAFAICGAREAAERRHRRIITLKQRHLGNGHPEVAITLAHLATHLAFEERHEESLELRRRALALREAAFGPDSVPVLVALKELEAGYRVAGDLEKADELQRKARTLSGRLAAVLSA